MSRFILAIVVWVWMQPLGVQCARIAVDMPPQRMSLPTNVRRFLRKVAPLSREAKRKRPRGRFEILVRDVEAVPDYAELPADDMRSLLEQVESLAHSVFWNKADDLDSRIYLAHSLARACRSHAATPEDLDKCIGLLQTVWRRRLTSPITLARHTLFGLQRVAENPGATDTVQQRLVQEVVSLTDVLRDTCDGVAAALATLKSVAKHPASSIEVLRLAGSAVQRACMQSPSVCSSSTHTSVAETIAWRLTTAPSLVAGGPASGALAVRLLAWQSERSVGVGYLACPSLLRLLAATPSPTAYAAPALEGAGLSPDLLVAIDAFAQEPAAKEAVWVCALAALSSSRPEKSREIADSLLAAVCAPVEDVGVQAALALKHVMTTFSPPHILAGETLESAARCLASHVHTSARALADQSAAVLYAVAQVPRRERMRRKLLRRGVDVLCKALGAHGEVVASRLKVRASYRVQVVEVCGSLGLGDSEAAPP